MRRAGHWIGVVEEVGIWLVCIRYAEMRMAMGLNNLG